ncbi:MAG: hypothetical protein SFW64_04535 [Alphaproteobacteria bacterium]|nr:hypothetical protein [Alphaproteobacteria bacterium]
MNSTHDMQEDTASEPVASETAQEKVDQNAPTAKGKAIDPELILAEPSKADRSKPIKVFGKTVPPGLASMLFNFNDFSSALRFKALSVLPGIVVNHSSNAIGMTQLVGEALYFKSSGVNKFVKDEHRGTWKAFVYPPINVVEGVFKKSAFRVDYKQLLNPKYIGRELKRFVDLEEAARIDFARDGKLSNRWSARSGFAGMTSMAIAAAFPDEKDNPEVTEKMALMRTEHPLGYVGYRVGKGLMFPITAPLRILQKFTSPGEDHHIGDGKREFSGIGMTLTGLFSVLAGFRQPRVLGNLAKYDFNPWQAAGGAITTFAGSQLLLGLDNQQGWTNYGKYQFGRLLVLPMNIKERFPNKEGWGDPNAKYYFGAQGVFQFKNVVASLIGGAQKVDLDDGRAVIIDQKRKRSEVQEKAREKAHATKQHPARHSDVFSAAGSNALSDDFPQTTVSYASVEPAMPKRVEEQQRMAEAAV